jgi:hypothetical protein
MADVAYGLVTPQMFERVGFSIIFCCLLFGGITFLMWIAP